MKERLHFAPGLAGLADLGVARAEELFEPARLAARQAVRVEESASFERVSFTLPAPSRERVSLSVWRGAPLRASLLARCTHPRSGSLAEREWNLLCHLRAHGVGTKEPLAVGARGSGFVARRSFLVVRELEGARPLLAWLAEERDPLERERGVSALGVFLRRLAHSGASLPELAPAAVWISPAGAGCGSSGPDPRGPRPNRLPGLALAEVRGARIRARLAAGEIRTMRERFVRGLEGTLRADELAALDAAASGALPGNGAAAQALKADSRRS